LIELVPTRDGERENFIVNLQAAFKFAAIEELGGGNEIIERADILECFDAVGDVRKLAEVI